MTAEYQPSRQGPGRRQSDQECAAHEDRLDSMERKFAWQKGAMYVISAACAVLLTLGSAAGSTIYGKLDSIIALLSENKEKMARIEEKVAGHEKRLNDIEGQHAWELQNGRRK